MTSHNHHHELPHKRTPRKLKREYAVWLLVAVALLLGLGVVAKMRMNHPFARCNAAKP